MANLMAQGLAALNSLASGSHCVSSIGSKLTDIVPPEQHPGMSTSGHLRNVGRGHLNRFFPLPPALLHSQACHLACHSGPRRVLKGFSVSKVD